jgi:hypothetical protein
MQAELLHQPSLVKFDRLDRHIEKHRHLFRALAFGDQLQDFLLPRREVGQRVFEFRLVRLQRRIENRLGNDRCEVDAMSRVGQLSLRRVARSGYQVALPSSPPVMRRCTHETDPCTLLRGLLAGLR